MKKFFYYIYFALLWVFFAIFIPTRFINKKREFKKGSIMICNHMSNFDVLTNITKFPYRPILFGKKELDNPFVRFVSAPMNIVLVDRGATDIAAIRTTLNRMKQGERLLLFPEGTRNKKETGELLDIKNGAAMFAIRLQREITPVLIHHKQRMFRRNYMYMGDSFDLSQFYGQKTNSELYRSASEVIAAKLIEARAQMEQIMQQKYGHKKWYKKYLLNVEREKELERLQKESKADIQTNLELNEDN